MPRENGFTVRILISTDSCFCGNDVPDECHGMAILGTRVKNNMLLSIEFLDPLTHSIVISDTVKTEYKKSGGPYKVKA